jgi:hypothetical protein
VLLTLLLIGNIRTASAQSTQPSHHHAPKADASPVSAVAAPAPIPGPPATAIADTSVKPDPNGGFSRLFGLVFGLAVAGGAVWLILRLVRNRGEGLVELARKAGVDVPSLDDPIPLAATIDSPQYKPKPPIEKIPEEATKPPAIPASSLAPSGSLARNNSYRTGNQRLVAEEGVASGSTFAISTERLAIGRDGDNDIVLADATVSRHHAVIIRDEKGIVTIEDGGSSNGVVINGDRVDRATLSPGDQIKIGDNYFRFQGM